MAKHIGHFNISLTQIKKLPQQCAVVEASFKVVVVPQTNNVRTYEQPNVVLLGQAFTK